MISSEEKLLPVALLVLQAAPAGAGVVPADFLVRMHGLVRRGRVAGADEAELRHLPPLPPLDLLLLALRGPDPEDAFHRGVHDALFHLLEHVEAFLLVFDERVALGVSPEADAFLQ